MKTTRIFLMFCLVMLLIGCSKKNYTVDDHYQAGKIEGYENGFLDGIMYEKRHSPLKQDNIRRDVKIFYVSKEDLNDENIIKEWWGFIYNSSNPYEISNGKYCEVAIWNFTDFYIYNRGDYYVLCD